MGKENINKKKEEKDLWIMSPKKHMHKITGETYNPLGNIRVALTYVDKDTV